MIPVYSNVNGAVLICPNVEFFCPHDYSSVGDATASPESPSRTLM